MASKDARYDQSGIGCALSFNSIMTKGQEVERLTLSEALATDRKTSCCKRKLMALAPLIERNLTQW